ncbi:MAG TPA: hypothetical protein VGS20_11230 [Candidatus Acidoferrales bacterium]|nr:hypothetical protein [Candidatus Acidoferrales bacterium]
MPLFSPKNGSRMALLALVALAGCGPRGKRARDDRIAAVTAVNPSLLQALHYRMIGPHRGGRVTAVAGVPGERGTFYMGATGGGVWKTTDDGEVWENVSDPFFAAGSVGAIAVAPSNPSVIYVGTGSACIRNNVQPGIGMYKSLDAGITWQRAGLDDAGQIARIRIDPHDPNLVYVAVQGHAFGPNSDRGVFRSSDGGRTWQKALFIDDRTGASDLAMDARNPKVLYAAMWTGVRHPWGLIGGSIQGGVFKTTDGGNHWNKLAGGLPTGAVGRIGVAVSPAAPSRVWALVDAAGGGSGVYRSDDGGESFQRLDASRALTGRSCYYAHIFADPKDPDVVYVGNTDFFKSADGGRTFSPIPMPHGDNHALWIDPEDTRVMIEGNDGGATITIDGGKTWSSQLNQPTAEIYRVVADDQFPYRVYGAQQDQYDALSLPSRSANFGARLQLQHWYAVGGMEGGFVAVDPRNPAIVYAGGPGGMITRYDRSEMFLRGINVYPEAGFSSASLRYRFTWNAPIFLSPLEPNFVYHTSNYVHRSTDGGQSWATISPDLTRNDKTKETLPAGNVGSESMPYPTISAFAESPMRRGVLWAGSDDGLVHLSRDDGRHWQDVTPQAMPAWATVNSIEPSSHDPARAFLAVFRYQLDDFHPYIFRTGDYGRSWTLLTDGRNGIPPADFVHVVREDPIRKGLLYAGTEFGMYVSFDDGSHWQSLQLNLPRTPVSDLIVHDDDLVLSTNGRSFWILDDVAPLRRLAVDSFSAPHLFTPRDAYRAFTSAEEDDQPYVGGACCVSNARDIYSGARIERHRLGEEPPNGVVIDAAFPRLPSGRVTLEILGADGKVLRTLVDTAAPNSTGRAPRLAAGLNRFVWDFRVESEPPGAPPPEPRGPKAVPGSYQARLTAGSTIQRAWFRLLPDPRLRDVTQQDYEGQFGFLMTLEDAIARIRAAAATLRSQRSRVRDPRQVAALDSLVRQLVPAPGAGFGAGQPPLLSQALTLYNFVEASEDQPTASAIERWTELRAEMNARLAQTRAFEPPAGAP